MSSQNPRPPLSTFARVANIFMIVAFVLGAFYIVSFVMQYPKFWFAAVLFLIIAVLSVVRRIAVLRGALPEHRAPVDDEPTDTTTTTT